MDDPERLRDRTARPLPGKFHFGTHRPFAIRWFGSSALLGHLRHLVASVAASASVDTRDWMRAQSAQKLLRSIARILKAREDASTLTEALGRPVWIDFLADTGDDRNLSLAVARMVFRSYDTSDANAEGGEAKRTLPRGDILVFGGDTAYPIASADEIFRRLTSPYNDVLRDLKDPNERRVLLGVPGNHDWYDGLDGFARLFRRGAAPPRESDIDPEGALAKRSSLHPGRASAPPKGLSRKSKKHRSRVGAFAKKLHFDEFGASLALALGAVKTTNAFLRGEGQRRRKRLGLHGYEPVQESSYFSLPLAPGLDWWGVDRQLRSIDFRQRTYFARRREAHPDARVLFLASDPALAFGEWNLPGARSLRACDLRMERDAVLYLTGDVHHYERRVIGPSMHVIAGGGGAFLHGTRILPGPASLTVGAAACAYPDAASSRRLVVKVPLRMMLGEAGFLPHGVFGVISLFQFASTGHGAVTEGGTALLLTALFVGGFYFNAAHHRQHPKLVTLVAVPFGAAMGLLPGVLRLALPSVASALAGDLALVLVYAFAASFVFGLFLATCAILGLEHEQAFAALGHPGFKHFVRLCVHPDGHIEGWAIGRDDPLDPEGRTEIVDRFVWP